ncbi:MAG TPA: DNA alkylation repair protein [Thermomicrobiales bacterium]|nr:DNA alkylation repair protein [Thermomicrobiales bacterium]
MSTDLSADAFIERLGRHQSDDELRKIQRYFKTGEGDYGAGDKFMGVRMGEVFALAKEFIEMSPAEIERLLDSPVHEVRAGALSIMDKQARRKKTPELRRKELFDLYLRRLDRIDNWDLVDLGAPFVIGGYLFDKPRDLLYELARSEGIWERRTAIYATSYFIRQGDLDDTFAIAEILIADDHDLIQKAVGAWLREAGKQDQPRLLAFLDSHAAAMPRTMLRTAIEKLGKDQRTRYLAMK